MELEQFLTKWHGTAGGAERANYVMFLTEFCQALGLPSPAPANYDTETRGYQFEAFVRKSEAGEPAGTGRIDLYKPKHFVLEAKQSRLNRKATDDLLAAAGLEAPAAPAGPRYDALMRDARVQAESYARALPTAEGWPPFLIVCDVGRAFDLYFDWSGMGKDYGPFPDRQSYRIDLLQLRDPKVQEVFRAIWTDPPSIDPRLKAVEVTRDVSWRLAQVSKTLEDDQKLRTRLATSSEKSLVIESTALFLMRILFCMFAQGVGLLPQKSFEKFLSGCLPPADAPADVPADTKRFTLGLQELWGLMARPGGERYCLALGCDVGYFNGGLFENPEVYPLGRNEIGRLVDAASKQWSSVEPAIFGTLLEQALTPEERAKLGAHYTPRPYVERLVEATIMEPLRAEWAAVQSLPSPLPSTGGVGGGSPAPADNSAANPTPSPSRKREGSSDNLAALAARATTFHQKLKSLRILDPACGTGNFLYVSMELLLRLEGEVLTLLADLGAPAVPGIEPKQFLGLELNPRAAVIAELVLWIGWLRWRIANDPTAVPEPVLQRTDAINFGRHGGYDAVMARTDTGEADLANPRPALWPEADFIIGNPPFIGGKDLREKLGGDYAEALWKANPQVPPSADFVMQWWDRAAWRLTLPNARLQRFGFVTTNSITQTFSRRVIEARLSPPLPPAGEATRAPARRVRVLPSAETAETPSPGPRQAARLSPLPQAGEGGISLVMAIPDHPWTKATRDSAAVRIAMTVAEAGSGDGRLIEVVSEAGLDTDAPEIVTAAGSGRINADLTLGVDLATVTALKANGSIAGRGVQLMGAGFIVTPADALALGLGMRPGLENHIRLYRNGRDLMGNGRGAMVIDLFGLAEAEVRQRYPEVWQHLHATVRVDRDKQVAKSPTADARSYLANWWIFGKPRTDLRPALKGLSRYIVTVETAKHRVFQFLEASILPDNMLVAIGSDDAFHLGVLSSNIHLRWTYANCALLGVASFEQGHRYTKSKIFDPFPFPDPTPAQRAATAELGEEIDATRKTVQAEHPDITLTGLYNLVEKLRVGATLPPAEADTARRARAGIILELHRRLDTAVAAAYGWPADFAPAEIVARLVALNAERAAEEAAGKIRWLRPDYQAARA